jgi:hypothetical protein
MKNVNIAIIILALAGCKSTSKSSISSSGIVGIEKTIEEYYGGYVDLEGNYIVDELSFYGRIIKHYDTKGNLIRQISIDDTEHQYSMIEYAYNSKKQIISAVNYSEEDLFVSKEKYIYEKDRISQIIEFNATNEIISLKKYEYNEAGVLKSIQHLTETGKLLNRQSYDVQGGYKVTIYFNKNNSEEFRSLEKYNNNDEKIEQKIIYPYGDENFHLFSYTYNEKGHWTERMISFNNFEVLEFTQRRIIYFKDSKKK